MLVYPRTSLNAPPLPPQGCISIWNSYISSHPPHARTHTPPLNFHLQSSFNYISRFLQVSESSIFRWLDGELFLNHPLFSRHPDALQMQMLAYFDEIELCNPLGIHVKSIRWESLCSPWETFTPSIVQLFESYIYSSSCDHTEKHDHDLVWDLKLLATKRITVRVGVEQLIVILSWGIACFFSR